MKVLQITNSLITGGAEKLLIDSIPKMTIKGVEVDLLLLKGKEYPFLKILKNSNSCKIYNLGMGSVYNPLLIFKIIPFLKKYDLIHVHLFPSLYWVALAKIFSLSKTKLVFTEHNTSNRRRIFFYKFFDKLIYSQYHKFITITEESKNRLYEHIGFKKSRYKVIENGIDLYKIKNARPLNDGTFEKYKNTTKLLMVSRFYYPKDQETLIKALKFLPENVILFLAGDGDNKKNCEDISEKLCLKDRVIFLGVRMDVPQLLKSADIIILSSVYEGLSLSSIEGMASGKPFIASDVPGLTEAVKGAGVLFPQGNSKELADQILKLVNNPSYYSDVSKKCIERSKEFDIEKMVDSYINLYKELE